MNGQASGRRYGLKPLLSGLLGNVFRAFGRASESLRRLVAHGRLAARLELPLPSSVVVLGTTWVYGTGRVRLGQDALLYPELHLETQGAAEIVFGRGCVLSRGVHVVAMAGVTIGDGTMIGEYTSIRDANHSRINGIPMREAGHTAKRISIGKEVWIGRGVAVLAGVSIGDGATIGANAVVTRDVPPGAVFAGVPAKALPERKTV